MSIKRVEEAIQYVRGWMDDDDDFWAYLDGNEMSTRYVLIDPIIRSLGWDPSDLYQCVVEFRKSGQADYVLFDTDENPAVIIESKNTGFKNLNLLRNNPGAVEEQLAGYLHGSGARAGVLTNGLIWRLYDLAHSRRKLANQLIDPVIDIYQDNAKISRRQIRTAARMLDEHLGAHRFGW